MSQLLNWIYVAGAVVALFGAAIFVHEFGHYWVARRRGMKVEAFAIGFGPKIFGWTRNGIEYSLRWIPAGGFVKLPQMLTSEVIEGSNEQPKEPVPPAPPFSRILVAFAGPLMNVVFAFAIATVIYFVGLPVLINPSIVGYVDPKSEEYKIGIRPNDRVVAVNGKPVSTWQEVQMGTILSVQNPVAVTIERGGERKTYDLKAEVNPEVGLKILKLDPAEHPEVSEVLPDGAAAEVGLQAKDVVLSFASVSPAGVQQLIDLIHIRAGQPTEMKIRRGNAEMVLQITPKMDPSTKKGRIGARLGPSSKQFYRVERPGPTPWASVKDVLDQMRTTFSALAHSKETGVGPKDLAGPVGILGNLAKEVNTDYRLALKFLILLNINLAFLNLLPIPVLDGGHIMMAIVEKIRRRPMSARLQENTTIAFAVILISFMLYVSFFDIKRIPLIKSMFNQDTQIESAEKHPASPAPSTAK